MDKRSRFTRGNIIFLFVVAFLAGMITKRALSSHVRVGYDDPSTIIVNGKLADIDILEQELIKKDLFENEIESN